MRQELCVIRRMQQDDLVAAAQVHKSAFSQQRNSFHWLACNLVAYPRIIVYVATCEEQPVGYCLWTQKGGFRPEVVLELEQIAVMPEHRGKGIASRMIIESLQDVQSVLAMHRSALKNVVITTQANYSAQRLYASVLGAKVEAVISNLYSHHDEAIMIARDLSHFGKPGPRSLASRRQLTRTLG
ncbi:GNAT family N-acetyltransferase [Halopseudomonas pelagia]|uniref:GNAT family N-acetyltransferase n=1 Tax=Halopseudomonas pelagia TaxID=553151 RepID=UPI0003A336D5|nr:GNAT family N-acetyltransferase [Halopseudomonas pelagia]|tara:strand:+ start:78133 stop:78684 length:552 start_codon:yes stop_codon:yes gene_type:complete